MKLRPLTNRAPVGDGVFETPKDGYYEICPKGEFPHDNGVTQVIDDQAVRAMADAFKPGDEILIDFDHESHDQNKRTTAAGWIQNLVARSDGLWAQVKWSNAGAQAVKGGEYRYISPVWLASDCQQLGGDRVRPLRLYDAGLTNKPNLQGIDALSNRDAKTSDAFEETDDSSFPSSRETPPTDAAQRFGRLVRNRQSEKNVSFDRAWSEATVLFNGVYNAMLRTCATQSDVSLAWVNRSLRQSPPHSQGVTVGTMAAPKDAMSFEGIVKMYQTNEGMNFERAWDKARRMYPSEWNQFQRDCAPPQTQDDNRNP
jgi:hypothetical protein